MITGLTEIIAHIGYPTHTFKSPMIYNPYFEGAGIPAVVVPMACQAPHLDRFLPAVFSLDNVRGALITMPHKVSVLELLDEVTPTVHIAGACNAVKKTAQGRLLGDLFDGIGDLLLGRIRHALKSQNVLKRANGVVKLRRVRAIGVRREQLQRCLQLAHPLC